MTDPGGTGLPSGGRRVLIVPVVTLVGIVVVLGAALGDPWSATNPWFELTPIPVDRPTPTPPTAAPPSLPPNSSEPLPDWVGTLFTVVMIMVGIAVVLLIIRVLLRLVGGPEKAAPLHTQIGSGGVEVSAPEVRKGLAEATELLAAGAGNPTDAIVRAWVALEEAAARSGVPRRPADTPSEFTGHVLEATPADRDGISNLLRLYRQARFSERPVTAEHLAEAHGALQRLAESWRRFEAAAQADPSAQADPVRSDPGTHR